MGDDKMYSSYLQPRLYQSRQDLYFMTRRGRRAVRTVLAAAAAILIILLRYDRLLGPSKAAAQQNLFSRGLDKCRTRDSFRSSLREPLHPRRNPRWNPFTGQNETIVLQNATLFDGESISTETVDIVFEKGLIVAVSQHRNLAAYSEARVYNLGGRFVTPGLVDIHSHHLEMPFAHVSANQDVNEKPHLGPITPFVRAIDGFKPYDPAIRIIASGGVTTSLNLPGSGNIIGGQAYLVKNLPNPGASAEPVVEDLLFDHGLRSEQRQRYLKMACGENPKYRYEHTRLGNAWLLRQHLEKAQKLRSEQDTWCDKAQSSRIYDGIFTNKAEDFIERHGLLPESLELEATVALLRGQFNVNIHCYEPQDLERMLDVLHEFGVHPNAFHHALEAWQVPDFLKQQEGNVTIATFAENALFKHEAYGANLRGPKILDNHGIRVVLKSDHTGEGNFAKHLLDQASVSHSYGLSELRALQSVTSAAAQSIQQDHRIGFVRSNFDADLVVWDSHPLAVGATPLQVFIDGREVLEGKRLPQYTSLPVEDPDTTVPSVRTVASQDYKHRICNELSSRGRDVVIAGITDVLLDHEPFNKSAMSSDWNLVLNNGKVQCFGRSSTCHSSHMSAITVLNLTNGYITPGLLAFGNNIGLLDISSEPLTGDGVPLSPITSDSMNIPSSKYGVHFGSRSFDRARLGGVTRAITAPLHSGGLLQGVSVGLRITENATVLDGGIWKDEVALHVHLGQDAKGRDSPTISGSVQRLHQIFTQSIHAEGSLYARAKEGSLPVVVHTVHPNDIEQVILLKRLVPTVNFVIYGGHGAHRVASALAQAKIPVILTGNRGAPDTWEKRHTLPGPPLSPAAAQVLISADVLIALAVKGDSKTHGLAREARFAGKWAGLNDREAIKLVSTNFNKILSLDDEDAHGNEILSNVVLWDGNPLRGEGSVVISITDKGKVGDCLPDVEGSVL
ncbi:hypothetical protein OPT61_g8972 [Boeremia exigua]|uniref:Uncharacterized protein n=1 Tax=Boeremia exigua TaxID=749465 RepID=A0ACC2HX52_9PLEO|nr:hypothetical protein OPT61_g8972 [Boeremia exigua]